MSKKEALQRLRKLAADRKRIEASEGLAVAAASRAGIAQKDIAAALERSREHVRRLARKHGIVSARRTCSRQ